MKRLGLIRDVEGDEMYKPLDAQFQAKAMRTGTAAWALQRLSGLFLTLYLVTHLIVIGTVVRGEGSFDKHALELREDAVHGARRRSGRRRGVPRPERRCG